MPIHRKPLVIANWKMNGDIDHAEAWLASFVAASSAFQSVTAAVCPAFPYIGLVAARLNGSGPDLAWGAQNLAAQNSGAFTGEVSALMLSDLRCRYVLVGHSERRSLFGETDEVVAAKIERATDAGLVPVICVGETLEEREAGRVEAVVGRQVAAAMSAVKAASQPSAGADVAGSNCEFVIAYEPVWAIGTGKTATSEQAQEVHRFIRNEVAKAGIAAQAVQILYGGSVKPGNAAELFAQPDIDGGLVGGASLNAADFIAICKAAQS